MTRPDSSRTATLILALLAVVLFAYPALRIGAAYELEYNEGWNLFLQSLAVQGFSPYTAPGPLFLNNYPPLSFYLVGKLGQLTGDCLLVGRFLSVAATLVIALSAATVVGRAGGSRSDSLLAGATCLGLFSTQAPDYVGINDPQLLAQGFLCAGFALYAGGRVTPRRMMAVALLFSLGLLTKHNVLILPLVVTIHVLIRVRGMALAAYVLTGLALGVVAAGVILSIFGTAFFLNLLAPRTYDVTRGFLLSQEVLSQIQAPLGAAALFLVLARSTSIKRKVGFALAGSTALGCVFSGGAGVDRNVFFDVYVAISISAGLAATWLRQHGQLPRSAPAALAVLFNLSMLLYTPQTLGRMVMELEGERSEFETLFAEDVAWLQSQPGRALCESILLCLKAGKNIEIDPYNLNQAMLTGRLPPDTLASMLDHQEFSAVQVNSLREHPVPQHPAVLSPPMRFVNFSDSTFDALDRSYTLKRVGLSGRFLGPRPDFGQGG